MKPALKRIGTRYRKLAPSVLAIALAAIVGGASLAPALAQERNDDRGRHVQRGHERHYSNRDRGYDRSYESPAYVYSPPPVYYAPPAPPSGINFVFPLRFR